MCYHIKTYRCGHFKRTFSGCKCTLHASGEQRQPGFCEQWFCNKKPYYSDGSCERDHITNINIGHHFNPATGRRTRYRPGARLRSLRPPRNNSRGGTTTAAATGIFAIPSSRLPTEVLEQLSIHPDELAFDHNYSMDWNDNHIPTRSRVLEVDFELQASDAVGHFFNSIPRAFTASAGSFSSPEELIDMITRSSRRGARGSGSGSALADAMGGILRIAHDVQGPPPPQTARTGGFGVFRRGQTATRPVRINPPVSLAPFRPTRTVVESALNPSQSLVDMDIDDLDALVASAMELNSTAEGATGQAVRGNIQPNGPPTDTEPADRTGDAAEGST